MQFGRNRIFPLKPEGETVPVTQENKREFVQLSANFRLYSSISEQIENLVAGFQEIIPKDLITIVRRHVFQASQNPHFNFSLTNKSLSYSFLGRLILTLTSGELRRNTTDTQARTPLLFGGGGPSSRSIVKREPRC